MTEPCTAAPLGFLVEVDGTHYFWSPETGLDPAAVDSIHRFICKRAKRLENLGAARGLSVADLIQEGRVGALEAARRFDATQGNAYITYAAFWIKQAQLQALRLGAVHVPTRRHDEMVKSGGLPPVASLDAALQADGELTMAGVLSLDAPQDGQVLAQQVRDLIWAGLRHLHGRYREVLVRRYGLRGEPETLAQIGASWGQSHTRVGQIQAIAECRLRHLLTHGTRP